MKRLILLQLLLVMFITSCDNKSDNPNCPDVSLEIPTLTNELDYEIFNAILSKYYRFYHEFNENLPFVYM